MEATFACDMSAFSDELRERHRILWTELHAVIQQARELANGYEVAFNSDPSTVLRVAEFATLERLCCPFFTFALELKENNGPLWLRVAGPDGVKPFIESELGIQSS